MSEIEVPDAVTAKIEQSFAENFGDMPPAAEYLLDAKALAANTEKKEKQTLVKEVAKLKQKLEEQSTYTALSEADPDSLITAPTGEDEDLPPVKTYDVILRVKPQKVDQIKSQIIDGKKCLVIPMEEDEHANVNGVNTIV